MGRICFLAATVLAIAFAMMPARGAQTAPPSAISIASCEVETSAPFATGDNAVPVAIVNGVAIRFSNSGTLAISDATFEISYGGVTQVVKDFGTFSPGVMVHHGFSLHPLSAAENGPQCRVLEAHYAVI
jgi:hypothetical protein